MVAACPLEGISEFWKQRMWNSLRPSVVLNGSDFPLIHLNSRFIDDVTEELDEGTMEFALFKFQVKMVFPE